MINNALKNVTSMINVLSDLGIKNFIIRKECSEKNYYDRKSLDDYVHRNVDKICENNVLIVAAEVRDANVPRVLLYILHLFSSF